MDDLVAFVRTRLDEEQQSAEAMEHFTVFEQPHYSCAGSRTEPYGDLEWGEEHCDCYLAERKAKRLREIAAMRAVAASYEKSVRMVSEGLSVPERRLTQAVAAIWNDHAGYSPEWSLTPPPSLELGRSRPSTAIH